MSTIRHDIIDSVWRGELVRLFGGEDTTDYDSTLAIVVYARRDATHHADAMSSFLGICHTWQHQLTGPFHHQQYLTHLWGVPFYTIKITRN